MADLQFLDAKTQRRCCDLAFMRERYGDDTARCISRRLQQLAALSALSELAGLPFGYQEVDSSLEIEVARGLVLLLATNAPTTGETHMTDLLITVVSLSATQVTTK